VPALCNALWPSAAEAVAAPAGPIDLRVCTTCSHVWNAAFDPDLVAYSPAYDNSLHFSPRFKEYAQALASHLVDTYGVRRRQIVEIGSGSGDFLGMLCDLGDNTGVGYDPSHDPVNAPTDPRIRVEARPYPAELDAEAGLVICQHVIEHLTDPAALVGTVAASVRDRDDVAVYFEMPDADHMLEAPAVWDLIYEHAGYFGATSLRLLFERAGLRVLAAGRSFGDQYLWLEAGGAGAPRPDASPDPGAVAATVDAARHFGCAVERTVAEWSSRLAQLVDAGPVAVWGAGSKGVQFLNLVQPAGSDVAAVVDVNPRKAGKHLPGTGHVVVPPEALVEHPPATVLVMNPIYRDEITAQLAALGLHPVVDVVT
jgi:hypothetical protein